MPKLLQKQVFLAFALVCGLSIGVGRVGAAQESTFDWIPATDESPRLDPANYYTGRVFSPGDQAGNVHVDIDAEEPITVEMAPAGEWSETMRHPELLTRVTFRCIHEHVTKMTYLCDVPPGRPMTLVLRDERTSEQTTVTSLGSPLTEHGTVREFISPNDVHIQYYRWACVENCAPPRYQWVSELKESYELSPAPKIYDGIGAERDGEPFSIKVSSILPITIAIIPSRLAHELREKPENLESALQGRACAEKSVRSVAFECMFDMADGPQSFIAFPATDTAVPAHKKVDIQVVASKCVANCLTDPEK